MGVPHVRLQMCQTVSQDACGKDSYGDIPTVIQSFEEHDIHIIVRWIQISSLPTPDNSS